MPEKACFFGRAAEEGRQDGAREIMPQTRIVILKRKRLMYTGIIAVIGVIVLIIIIILCSRSPEGQRDVQEEALYTPGIYSMMIPLGDNLLNLELVADSEQINGIRIVDMSDAVTTMYPLLAPSLEDITEQLKQGISVDELKSGADGTYTQELLKGWISELLTQARCSTDEAEE